MPNRIIKSSIHTSETVNRMTDFQFRLWISLITYVDDYGRGDARPAVIRGNCFPLRDRLTNKDIETALMALADIGCVGLYEVDGKPYLYFPTWEQHQRVRTKVQRFPAPPCGNSPQIAADCGLNPESRIRIQNTESESESEDICAELLDPGHSAPQETPGELPVICIPLVDGTEFPITQQDVSEYAKLYPAVDVMQELRAMVGWCKANPQRKKTKKGVRRFVNGWLAREQDKGGYRGQRRSAPVTYSDDEKPY